MHPKYDFDYIKLKEGDIEGYYTYNLEDDEEDLRLSDEEYELKYGMDDLSTYDNYMNWLKWLVKYESKYHKDYSNYLTSMEIELKEPKYLIASFREYTAVYFEFMTPKARKKITDTVNDLENSIIDQVISSMED